MKYMSPCLYMKLLRDKPIERISVNRDIYDLFLRICIYTYSFCLIENSFENMFMTEHMNTFYGFFLLLICKFLFLLINMHNSNDLNS